MFTSSQLSGRGQTLQALHYTGTPAAGTLSIDIRKGAGNFGNEPAPLNSGRNLRANEIVLLRMAAETRRVGVPEWLVLAGGCGFVFVLGLSAWWEPDIRWLHVFQAWMYAASIVLSLRGSRWGYFIGFSAAGFWDYANIFATTFFFNGLQTLSQWIHSGHLSRPDLLIAVPAWCSNLLVVLGCVWAYSRQAEKPISDAGRLLVALASTTGFFAADMAIWQPRYLGIFPRLLHPHLP